MEDPGVKHWDAVLRIMQYLKGTQNVGIVFDGSVTPKGTSGYFSYPKADVEVFVDADHDTNKDDRRSVSHWICIYVSRSTNIMAKYVSNYSSFIIYGSGIHGSMRSNPRIIINDVKRMLSNRYKMKNMGLLDWILGMEVIH